MTTTFTVWGADDDCEGTSSVTRTKVRDGVVVEVTYWPGANVPDDPRWDKSLQANWSKEAKCRTFWGSHGCELPPDHDGRHWCSQGCPVPPADTARRADGFLEEWA